MIEYKFPAFKRLHVRAKIIDEVYHNIILSTYLQQFPLYHQTAERVQEQFIQQFIRTL